VFLNTHKRSITRDFKVCVDCADREQNVLETTGHQNRVVIMLGTWLSTTGFMLKETIKVGTRNSCAENAT